MIICLALLVANSGCGSGVANFADVADASTASFKTYSVASFGAKGNGVADDGIAIQKAMTTAAVAGGGIVSFPCGEFAVLSVAGLAPGGRSALYLKGATNVTLRGQGSCSHVFTALPQKSVFEFEDSDLISVTAMKVSALNAVYVETYGMDGGSAIRFTGVTNGNVSSVEVDSASAGAIYMTKGTSHTSVANNNIHDTYGSGIWEDDCGAASATTCAPNRAPSQNVYTSNTLTNTSMAMTTAMTFDDGGASSYAIASGNTISWTRAPLKGYEQNHCIQIANTSDVSLLNNSCTGTPYDGIVVTTGNRLAAMRDTIQGNTIQSSGSAQIGGSGIVLYDDPKGGGISGFVIADNTITNALTDGIRIASARTAGGIHDGQITGNAISMVDQMKPGTRYGIDVEASASIAVSNNSISCNGSCIAVGVYVDKSTATVPTPAANVVNNIVGVPLLIFQ